MGSNVGDQSTNGPARTGERTSSSVSVGREPPSPPDVEAEMRLVEAVAPDLENERHPIVRVAVEDAAVVEHVTGALVDEPSIVATSVGHVGGPDSRSAFDVVLAREHDPEVVAGAIAAIDGVRGVSATKPAPDESSNGRGSTVPAGLDHTFADLKSDVDRESYDTVVAELEAVDFGGADGTDVSLDDLLADDETSAGAPTAAAGVEPGDATGDPRDPLDPLLDSLVAALENVDLSAAQRERVRRAAGLEDDAGAEVDGNDVDAGTEAGGDDGDAGTEAGGDRGDRDRRGSSEDLDPLASALGEVLEAVAVDTHCGDRLDELESRVADVETEVEIFSTVRNQVGTLPDAGSAP